MSLRARITLLVIGLLTAVLLGAGWSLARGEEREYRREIEARMRHLGFSGVRRFRPPPRPRGGPGATFERQEPSEVELEEQADGAHAEVFAFHTRPGDASPELIGRATTGEARVDVETAISLLDDQPADVVSQVVLGATPYEVLYLAGGGERAGGPRDPERARGRRGPGPAQLVVLLERDPPRAVLTARLRRAATIGLLALALGAALAYLLAGRMLRPVRQAAEAAEAIDSPDQRLPDPAQTDELGRLVNVLNGMLGRIEAGARRERTFLATASHELRRPLAALRGEIDLALSGERDAPTLREALTRALGDAKAMGRLVDDLLQHARARAGAAPLVEADVDWVELVTEAVERSRRALPTGVRVQVHELPAVLVHADAMRLGQVVENLVTNGGTHGGPRPHVVVRSHVDDEGLTLVVEDDGVGIAEGDRDTIFEPFGRGDGTRSVPGAGLGLAIAKDGVQAHGGRIRVVSPVAPDASGARFEIHLPASRVRPLPRR